MDGLLHRLKVRLHDIIFHVPCLGIWYLRSMPIAMQDYKDTLCNEMPVFILLNIFLNMICKISSLKVWTGITAP